MAWFLQSGCGNRTCKGCNQGLGKFLVALACAGLQSRVIKVEPARRSNGIGWLAATTPLAILLAHYLAVLPHEFLHSFVAWATGIKSNPFDLHWGGGSVGNILLLYNIDEKVDYKAAYAAGEAASVAAAAIAGLVANVVLYLVIRFAAPLWRTSRRPFVAYLAFWFLFMQLANIYDYVPIRVAASDGDVGQWVRATHMSPWLIYVVVGYVVLWAMVDFYRVVMPEALDSSGIASPASRAVVLVIATVVMFTYFAWPGLLEDGLLSVFIARTSLLLIPVVLIANWRRIVTRTTWSRRPDRVESSVRTTLPEDDPGV
jgi:hypothetical protein